RPGGVGCRAAARCRRRRDRLPPARVRTAGLSERQGPRRRRERRRAGLLTRWGASRSCHPLAWEDEAGDVWVTYTRSAGGLQALAVRRLGRGGLQRGIVAQV